MTDNQILDDIPAEKQHLRQNKTTLLTICALLVVGLFSYYLNSYYFQNATLDTLLGLVNAIARIWAIVILIRNGTLLKTHPLYQLILFFFGIAIIGNLFKLQHWPYSNVILVLGLLGIPIIYAIRFIKKQNKNALDLLKFIWVTVLFIGELFRIQHLPYSPGLRIIENMLLVIIFLYFSYQCIQVNETAK